MRDPPRGSVGCESFEVTEALLSVVSCSSCALRFGRVPGSRGVSVADLAVRFDALQARVLAPDVFEDGLGGLPTAAERTQHDRLVGLPEVGAGLDTRLVESPGALSTD